MGREAGGSMRLGRYEVENIKNQIFGYMISKNFNETHEQWFERAKKELLMNLRKHVEHVEAFDYSEYVKREPAQLLPTDCVDN
jgi:hypothetical protein